MYNICYACLKVHKLQIKMHIIYVQYTSLMIYKNNCKV